MSHSLVVVVPELSAEHSARLREAAARHGFECHICMDFAQSQRFLPDAEVILGSDVSLAGRAPKLKWMCSHFAGVDPFLKEGVSPQKACSGTVKEPSLLPTLPETLPSHTLSTEL